MKPKIFFILHYPPPVHGAAMVGEYIKKSKIINNAVESRYLNLGTSRTVNEIGSSGFKKWTRYLNILLKTVFNVLSFRPNLIYMSIAAKGIAFYKDAFIAIIARVLVRKIVFHMHNKGVSTRQDNWLDNILYKIVFKDAEVILLSGLLYSDIQKYVPKDRVHHCPNGIPEIFISSESKGSDKVSNKVEILFLSNLIESKGVFVLLEACKILKRKGVVFQCTYVGGEGDISAEKLQNKIEELDLKEQVNYNGKKYGEDKLKILARTDIFTLPTFYSNECLPLVLLEAMQFSLPSVSTFEGGIPDVLENGKTGFLVKQNDATALAGKLEVLINNPALRDEMGAKARKKYQEEFTLQSFEHRFVSILKTLV